MNMRQHKRRHYIRLYVRSLVLCDYTPLSQWVKKPDEERKASAYKIFPEYKAERVSRPEKDNDYQIWLKTRAEIEGREYED